MLITESELELLKATKSENEWNDACDKIKDARDGQYPPDWYVKVLASGLMHQICSKF
jgi:hypothetical protein